MYPTTIEDNFQREVSLQFHLDHLEVYVQMPDKAPQLMAIMTKKEIWKRWCIATFQNKSYEEFSFHPGNIRLIEEAISDTTYRASSIALICGAEEGLLLRLKMNTYYDHFSVDIMDYVNGNFNHVAIKKEKEAVR